jgi:Ran GTPase-activating protein (RanGAP) involved in mRNA processing and transport
MHQWCRLHEQLLQNDQSETSINVVGVPAQDLRDVLRVNTNLYSITVKFEHTVTLDGIKEVCTALHTNLSLRKVDIRFHYFGHLIMKEWFIVPKYNKNITSLLFGSNQIGDRLEFLCESIKNSTSVTVVDLSKNNIGHEGMKEISEMLKINQSIKSLDLSSNEFGTQGAKYLGESLKLNKTLKKLNLMGNLIED